MDHLGPFAGVEARNTRFGDLSSHLHTHNLCQEKEDHFTLLPGKTLLDLLFSRNHRNLLILKRAFSQPALSFAFIVQFWGSMFNSHRSLYESTTSFFNLQPTNQHRFNSYKLNLTLDCKSMQISFIVHGWFGTWSMGLMGFGLWIWDLILLRLP